MVLSSFTQLLQTTAGLVPPSSRRIIVLQFPSHPKLYNVLS